MSPNLATLNAATRSKAIELMEPLLELFPRVPEMVVGRRPFASDEALAETILTASPSTRLSLFGAHPAPGGRRPKGG